MRKLDRTIEFIQKHGPTAFQAWIVYSVIWVLFFGVAWLLKVCNPHDPIPLKIFNFFYYAGYPAYGLVLCFFAFLTMLAAGIVYLFHFTMPWGLYCLPFLGVIYIIWRVLQSAAPQIPPDNKPDKYKGPFGGNFTHRDPDV